MRAASEGYYKHPTGRFWLLLSLINANSITLKKEVGFWWAIQSCIWVQLGRQCQVVPPTGNAKEVKVEQHGNLQDPALSLRKQFLNNPEGRSSSTWKKARKQVCMGGAYFGHSFVPWLFLHSALAQKADFNAYITRLPLLWTLRSLERKWRKLERCFFSYPLPGQLSPGYVSALSVTAPLRVTVTISIFFWVLAAMPPMSLGPAIKL